MQFIKKNFLVILILCVNSSCLYAEPVTITIAVAASISALCQIYSTGQSLYDKQYPDEQAQVNTLAAKDKLEYIQAKNNFKKCLSSTTAITKKNSKNIPTPCQDLAQAFIQCGGKNEMIQMIQNFDDAHE